MKKSIAILALSASSTSAFALMAPHQETKTICLNVYEDENGVERAGNCDQSRNNATNGLPILANGCAEDQIALTASKYQGRFDIEVRSCLPPNIVQL